MWKIHLVNIQKLDLQLSNHIIFNTNDVKKYNYLQ